MSIVNGKRITTEEFINVSNKIHNFKYDYSKTEYLNSYTKVKIICPNHGLFLQNPTGHRKGQGCIKCGRESAAIAKSLSSEQFIEKSASIHKNKYNYSKMKYINSYTKIEIICPLHGSFFQVPSNHLYGKNGCPSCGSLQNIKSVSKDEIKWLNSFNNSNIIPQQKITINNESINVDGYDLISNTVYEFYGDFWHGNPKVYDLDAINPVTQTTFGYLYNKTLDRAEKIKNNGYNLIEQWKTDLN